MMRTTLTFLAGLVFALGLGVSGMTQPARVLGFLDLFGAWDASLAWVMAGAVGTHLLLLRLGRRRSAAGANVLAPAQHATGIVNLEERRLADPRLLGGAALFGAGWGLVGFCPGPALVALVTGWPAALVFAAAMVGGMLAFRHLPGLLRRRQGAVVPPARAALTQECG
jgi:hypothetical protein